MKNTIYIQQNITYNVFPKGESGGCYVSEITQSQNGKYGMIPPKAGSKMVRHIETEMEKTRMKSIINIFEEKHEIVKKIKIQ